ncbi:hypothetical protein EZV62_005892 [Acer yangbiense]|uniref:Citrate transporter-like domain-containing protein n=1 Tax=Acer yangbiense TaxID=1000413 RepID=A0A5C7INJ5_9ROSI|nr:hypothetical protein EZV62_005892 [Acer yangbiense]
MAMAPTVKVVLGSLSFAIFWILAVFPAVPLLPIGRTAGSLLGAMLMVIFQVINPDQAYAAIDLPILGLLFGTMVVSVYLEKADMFKYLTISSALFTNDTSCVVFTEFVLKIARQHNLPPHPFLLALASSANIGSSATPIGNPQNLVIAVQSKISFGNFVIGILPAMLVGVIVNALILLAMYWKLLSSQKDEEDATAEIVTEEDVNSHQFSPVTLSHVTSLNPQEWNSKRETVGLQSSPDVNSHHFSPATLSHVTSLNPQEWNSKRETVGLQSSPNVNGQKGHVENTLRGRANSVDNEIHRVSRGSARFLIESKEVLSTDVSVPSKGVASVASLRDVLSEQSLERKERWKRMFRKACLSLVTIGMLVSLLMGLNMSWTAIAAALALAVLDFKDARPNLEKVSYSLLIFFCGMFITVDGFNRTGIPSNLWDLMEPHAQIDHIGGIAVLAVVILVLSNLASNVPTVKTILALSTRKTEIEKTILYAKKMKQNLFVKLWSFNESVDYMIVDVMVMYNKHVFGNVFLLVLLLGARVAASAAAISEADEKKAWLILAWVSTVAGNLSLLGSAANLIVCEQARSAPHHGYTLTFWRHLKFGLPSTLIITAIGLTLIR